MQCNKCGRNAVLFQEYSGQHLCKQHFEADVEAKAKHEIRRHQWIIPGDHIAVALSGDQSSSALLYFLKKLTSDRRDIRISAISIDEGIAGYRDSGYAKRIAELLDTECIMGSFQEYFGITVDEITQIKDTTLSCTYCRVLRNFLLNRIAREHGITKLAFGYTLDEGAVSVLKNMLKGVPEIGGEFRGGCQRKNSPDPTFPSLFLIKKWHSMQIFMSKGVINPAVLIITIHLRRTCRRC